MIKTIAVIGSSGYIASALCPRLEQYGFKVIQIESIQFANQHTTYVNNLLDSNTNTLFEILSEADLVIYAAAINGQPATEKEPEIAVWLNGNLPSKISENFSTLYLGAESSYGDVKPKDHKLGIQETDKPNAKVAYAVSKLYGEECVILNKGTVLRLATVFGPSSNIRTENLIHGLAVELLQENKLEIYQPDTFRNILYIEDLLQVLINLISTFNKTDQGQIYNIATRATTKRTIVETFLDLIYFEKGRDEYLKIKFVDKKDIENRQFILATNKIKQRLPNIKIQTEMKNFIQELNFTLNALKLEGKHLQ